MAAQTLGFPSGLFVKARNVLLHLDLENYNYNFDRDSKVLPPKADVVDLKYMDEEFDMDWIEAVQVRSKIYMVPTGNDSLPVFEFDPIKGRVVFVGDDSDNIDEVCLSPTPIWCGLETFENKIYIFGMFSKEKFCFKVFDPSSDSGTWKNLPLPPNDVCDGSATVSTYFVFGHKLYGVISSSPCRRALRIISFDTRKESWNVKDDMFNYKYNEYNDGVPFSMIPIHGKMVLPNVMVAFRVNKEASQKPFTDLCLKWDLYGYLYSDDGCFLATQNLGDLVPRQQYASSTRLIAMEDPRRFCAVSCGYNFDLPNEDDDRSNVIVVSFCRVKKLHKASATASPHLTKRRKTQASSSTAEVEKEEEFLSLEIEQQYFFSVQHLGPLATYTTGLFLAN